MHLLQSTFAPRYLYQTGGSQNIPLVCPITNLPLVNSGYVFPVYKSQASRPYLVSSLRLCEWPCEED